MPAAFSSSVDEGKDLLIAQPARLQVVHFLNGDAAIRYLQLFDANDVADVTLGTTPPSYVIHMGSSAGGTVILPMGLDLRLGLVACATTTPSGSTGVTADAFVSVVWN